MVVAIVDQEGLLEDGDAHQSTTLFKTIGLWLSSDPVTEEMGND
jgi:hypothetical protein